MKTASREGARTVLVLGPEELEKGVVVARDMTSGEQREIPIAEIV